MNFLTQVTVSRAVTFARGALVTLLASLALGACGKTSSDEEKIRALLASAETAAEARDASDVMAQISDEYSDSAGRTRDELANLLRGYLLMHPKIELLVDIGALEFPVDGLARARVTIAMLGTQGDANDSSATGDMESFDLEFRRAGDDWRISRADRVTAGGR
jgi:hypothetical protein